MGAEDGGDGRRRVKGHAVEGDAHLPLKADLGWRVQRDRHLGDEHGGGDAAAIADFRKRGVI